MFSLCFQLSSALMFDAVHVVVSAVRELNRSQEIGVKPLSCTSPLIWQHGTSLMNYLRMVNTLVVVPASPAADNTIHLYHDFFTTATFSELREAGLHGVRSCSLFWLHHRWFLNVTSVHLDFLMLL